MSVEALVKEYQKLSEAERLRFLELIHPYDESKDDLSEEWKAELDRRLAAYESGQVKPIDGKKKKKKLIAEYGIEL